MQQTIKKSECGNNLEINMVVPLKSKRCNPYDEEYEDEMDNIAGCVERRFDKCGFVYVIDMEYAGKMDQFSDHFFIYDGTIKEFEKLCKKLKIDIIYYDSPNDL